MNIREKILVIEDEKSIARFISTILTANGYEAMRAASGAEAMSMISSHCPDLVILDLGLPDMDGLDILRQLPQLVHPTWWWSPPWLPRAGQGLRSGFGGR